MSRLPAHGLAMARIETQIDIHAETRTAWNVLTDFSQEKV